MDYIDAHAHVWTDDTAHYPLGRGWRKEDMAPATFAPRDLMAHARANGVERVNLIQMSYYYPKDLTGRRQAKEFDNSFMLDAIAAEPKRFVGTAVIDPEADGVERLMTDLSRRGVKAFRLTPRLTSARLDRWLTPEGFGKMFAQADRNGQALSFLVDPDGLPEIDRMARRYPGTAVVIDHLARIGANGRIEAKDVGALLGLARHKKTYVKVGAFYALGAKRSPYADLAELIEKVVKEFGAERCMWESDCPFQVSGGHNYKDSIDLIKTGLKSLTAGDKGWLLKKTAEKVFFG